MNRTIFITGPSASGKSTLSRRLAHEIGFNWLDTGSVIRMTALVMENAGVTLPESYEEALETPCPPWDIGKATQTGEIPIIVGGQILDYDDVKLRSPRFDTNTVFLARALRPRTWSLLENVAMNGQTVISSRRVPGQLLLHEAVLPIYLDLSPENRVVRRARYEQKAVDTDIVARVIDKEIENTSIGNLVSPKEAIDAQYVLVQNAGTLDRSAAQLMLEVIRKYESYIPMDYEAAITRLQTVPAPLKHYTLWSELIRSLQINDHPEGYKRDKERG